MRLDHIAYRVADRTSACLFFRDAFNYRIQDDFEITLEDGSVAKCISLEPPEKQGANMEFGIAPFVLNGSESEYHMAPEIFISSGPPGSLIDRWVKDWGRGVGGIHHLAYQVENVQKTMEHWKAKGWLFTTPEPLKCESLTQVFSQPNPFSNIIYEFIERKGQRGFCKENVGRLMFSTANTIKP
jgi:4-hydroxyphenylpyruvate dioxygenase-like putative hemolysin